MNNTTVFKVNEYKLEMDAYHLQVKKIFNSKASEEKPVLVFLHDSLGCK